VIRTAVKADAPALARLHATSLPSSLLTLLGHAALVRYYELVIASAVERVEVADDRGVLGGCVLSDEPHTLLGRFAKHSPLRLARDLAAGVLRDPALRSRLAHRFTHAPGQAAGPFAPEVTQIFTDAAARGRGIGAALLRSTETALRARSVPAYYVHTHRDNNEAGIRFYRREGFETVSEGQSFGEVFLVMRRSLDA
jgi:GNAT superfamily N-acetyltransferase